MLAVAGIFSATAVAFNKQVNEQPVAEKAEAFDTNFASGSSIYLRLDGSFTASNATCFIKVRSTGGDWREATKVTATQDTKGGETLYVYTFGENVTEWGINRRNSGGTDNWGWSNTNISTHTHNLFTIYHHSDWGWDKQVEIVEQPASVTKFYFKAPTNGSVALAAKDGSSTSKGSISTNTLTYVYSDWKVTYTATGSTGYDFKEWTYSDSQSGTYSRWEDDATTNPFTVTTNIDLYHSANFQKKTYTITFYQNDTPIATDSYRTTDTKTHGVNYTFPSLASMDPARAASGGRYFVKWSTDEHGESGDDYYIGDTYDEDSALTLYMIQNFYHYQYTNDGENWFEMERHNGDSTYDAIYYPDSAHLLKSGNAIQFRRYVSDPSESLYDVPAITWEGNYDSEKDEVVYSCSAVITLKVTRTNTHLVIVPGYSQRSIVVNHGGSISKYYLAESTYYDYYTSLDVTLYPGDTISAGYQNESTGEWSNYNPGWLEGDSEGDFTADSSQSTPVYCNAPGVFTIHLISGYKDTSFNNLKFVMNNSSSAALFAQVFNSDISGVCTGITGGSKTFNDLKNKMGTSSSTANTEYRYYNSLNSAAKALIVSDNSGSDIDLCVKKYNFILSKYGYGGSGQLVDFMGKNPPKPAVNLFSSFGLFGSDENNVATIIIVISSSVALLSVTALSILVIRKRKSKEQ